MGEQKKRLLVYDDNPEYGGHQVMAALALEGLARDSRLEMHFWYNPENRKWRHRLERMGVSGISTGEARTETARLQVMRNLWQRATAFREEVERLRPDLILFIQGDIEHSSLAMQEAKRAGMAVASYIPMVHSYGLMQAKLPLLRDLLARRLFRMPENWITISASIASQLRGKSPKATVHVVENGIQVDDFRSSGDRRGLRKQWRIPEKAKVCAMIGRVEFNQKRQDLAVASFSTYRERFDDWHLLIVGSGPDEDSLQQSIRESPVSDRIHRLAWLDEPQQVYSAIDCLLLPSRYEGVPLVMLEALAAGVPVLGSDRDGMRDLLPEEWRFPPGDAGALASAFHAARRDGFGPLESCRAKVLRENRVETFQEQFVRAVMEIIRGSG